MGVCYSNVARKLAAVSSVANAPLSSLQTESEQASGALTDDLLHEGLREQSGQKGHPLALGVVLS